jgi:hypothetical protein
MIEISEENMTLVLDGEVITTARFSRHAAADGNVEGNVSPTQAPIHWRPGDLGHGPRVATG